MDTLKRNGPMLFGILVFVGLILLGVLRPDDPPPPSAPAPAAKSRWTRATSLRLVAERAGQAPDRAR